MRFSYKELHYHHAEMNYKSTDYYFKCHSLQNVKFIRVWPTRCSRPL